MSTDRLRVPGLPAALFLCVCAGVLVAAGCAKRVPPPALPAVLAHPDFLYPEVPAALTAAPGASRVDVGWRYLQIGDLKNAELEFNVALKLGPRLYPAKTGQAYVAMAMRDHNRALAAFDAALEVEPSYVPALVGRGQTLLAVNRPQQALASFEKALSVNPSLSEVSRRVDVLRFHTLQDLIDAGRSAASEGRLDDARTAYQQAVRDSPESAFLHRELGLLERRAGAADAAVEHLRRAVDLDSGDALALVALGELLDVRGDPAGAEDAFRKAASADPSLELESRIAVVAEKAREARLPAEFRAALTAPQVTRGDLAALVGVRLGGLLERAPAKQVVVTDARGHWAATWITQTASAGVLEPFENHTFQPRAPVRRGDLATVVSRLATLIASSDPALRERLTRRPPIADLAPSHLQYNAVASVVGAGLMPLLEGNRFQIARQVTGEEAVEVIDRVRLMATTLDASRP